jgi:hypothetical protein
MKQITTARATDSALKIFAVTFVVSSAATLCLREFGLGSKIWPAHPFMATHCDGPGLWHSGSSNFLSENLSRKVAHQQSRP